MNAEVKIDQGGALFILPSEFCLLHFLLEGWQSGLSRRGANAESPHRDQRFESSTLR